MSRLLKFEILIGLVFLAVGGVLALRGNGGGAVICIGLGVAALVLARLGGFRAIHPRPGENETEES